MNAWISSASPTAMATVSTSSINDFIGDFDELPDLAIVLPKGCRSDPGASR